MHFTREAGYVLESLQFSIIIIMDIAVALYKNASTLGKAWKDGDKNTTVSVEIKMRYFYA